MGRPCSPVTLELVPPALEAAALRELKAAVAAAGRGLAAWVLAPLDS